MSAPLMRMKSEARRKNGMKIVVCPSGFKESLEPEMVADCIEAGILRVLPHATVKKAPLVDGGEGFARALVTATSGQIRELDVIGPVGETVESHFGFLGGDGPKTAVVEMAAAAGLRLVPSRVRNPGSTTTYGVGQTIMAALEQGAEKILVGCGDSGTCDGGVGMAQALGARFLDHDGNEIPPASGGMVLCDLASVDISTLHPLLQHASIDVACNWHNILCGPTGVARVFGPQKGATPADVEDLAVAMNNVASVMGAAIGKDIGLAPGSGASGGLGAGLMLIGATLHPRFDIIMRFLDIDSLFDDCELVITAEGGIDYQTPRGKVPAEVAKRAKRQGLPVIALAGTVGKDSGVNYEAGIDAFASILQCPTTLENAIADAERLLIESAETTMRMVMVGRSLRRQNSLYAQL